MSGDEIKNLKMVKKQPSNQIDLEYTKKLLEPFEDVAGPLIERFNGSGANTGNNRTLFTVLAIGLVLFLTFPKVRNMSGINEYILWLISLVILIGVVW